MKRWAFITIALYGLVLLALTLPLGVFYFVEWGKPNQLSSVPQYLSEFSSIYKSWGYWLWLGLLLLSEGLLLLVPVDLARQRQPKRRKLIVPAVTTAFLLANLFYAGIFAVAAACFGDDASGIVEGPASVAQETAMQLGILSPAMKSMGISRPEDFFAVVTALGMFVVLWMIWGLIFFHYAQADASDGLMRRATRWLLRASILELLVAVPSHVIVRHRDNCCAPALSFWGIVTGLTVMLLSFGPGVFFLFAKRMRQLQPPPAAKR